MSRKRFLNLYAGLGGTTNLISEDEWEIVNVELDPKIAEVLKHRKPNQEVIICDAHQYLLENYQNFDAIGSSPPCQPHSKMNKFTRHNTIRYIDGKLFEEILLLKYWFKGFWFVENVVPYYDILMNPKKIGRHLFWSNFEIPDFIPPEQPKGFINLTSTQGKKVMMDWLDIHYEKNIYYGNNHCPVQILRNCVHPLLGKHVIDSLP